MKKGEIELGEILFIFLIVCGIVLATYIISSSGGNGSAYVPPSEYGTSIAQLFSYTPDATIGELLNEGLTVCDMLFYADTESGDFLVTGYSWTLGDRTTSPDSIPVVEDDIRTSAALFDDRYISSLRGFAFKVYESQTDPVPSVISGLAAFNSEHTYLDDYYENCSTFSIRYYPERSGKKRLEGCSIISKDELKTQEGNDISVYFFKCGVVWSG